MRLSLLLLAGLTVLLGVFATDNGLQTTVEWDNGSLQVDGERILVMSGEFHYQVCIPDFMPRERELIKPSVYRSPNFGSTSSRNSRQMA